MTVLADAPTAARRDRDALVGMVIFLGAWSMTFLALFFAYGDVRLGAPAWPPPGEPRLPLGLPALATLALAASSLALARERLGIGLGLGLVFLAVQAGLGLTMWRAGLRPSSGRYGSVYFTLTAFHALHVLVGLGGVASLLVRARGAAARRNWRLYWHFVDGVWLVLFLLVYVW